MASKKPNSSEENKGKGIELDKRATLDKLQPYFMYGMAIKKAVNAHNAKTNWTDYISPLTIRDWYTEIPAVADIIDAWRESGEVQAHKTWFDAMRAGNYQAAREWLKVKDKEEYGETEDTQERMIIEFATAPSPFMTGGVRVTKVTEPVQTPMPQSKNFHTSQVKKKSKPPVKKKTSGAKTPKSTKRTDSKSGTTTEKGTAPKKSSGNK